MAWVIPWHVYSSWQATHNWLVNRCLARLLYSRLTLRSLDRHNSLWTWLIQTSVSACLCTRVRTRQRVCAQFNGCTQMLMGSDRVHDCMCVCVCELYFPSVVIQCIMFAGHLMIESSVYTRCRSSRNVFMQACTNTTTAMQIIQCSLATLHNTKRGSRGLLQAYCWCIRNTKLIVNYNTVSAVSALPIVVHLYWTQHGLCITLY